MTTANCSSRSLKSLTESQYFRESIMISDSKITKRRKNLKNVSLTKESTLVPETLLGDSMFKTEKLRKSSTFDNMEHLTFDKEIKDTESSNTILDNILYQCVSLYNKDVLEGNNNESQGLEKIKNFIDGPFTEMINNCQNEEACMYYCDTLAAYCTSIFYTYDKQ
ncbi:Hypothetical protein SRAE_2000191900 [Strongyloides ratti]|uniref:Uncharacterized protein n=1 Tax=Strongyloides ratti TaxID=34506 RepID=A0A090LIF5_STRRB|nr:Hypothetical protein SRAE_2000191900 [Strongyloides ratti]CEF67255.1 Hypothetical protein SRAE_2000191900 [Strongyloides ratti]